MMKARIYFLDNLRTFLIFFVVVIHSGIVYEPVLENTWIVSDPIKSGSIGLIRMYLELFVMFTIFFISGYFIPNSLKGKSTLEYLKSKSNRILLPWIIAVLTLIPAYKIIFLYSRGLPQEEWYSYFHFFERAGADLSIFSNNLSQSWLWFLPVLFLFQILYLAMSKFNMLNLNISIKTGVIATFIFGVIYSMIVSYSGNTGWTLTAVFDFQNERLLVYFMIFLLGTLCNKWDVFESGTKNKKLYIIANVVLTFSLGIFTAVALNLFFNMIDPDRNYFFVSEFVDRLAYYSTGLLSTLSFIYILIYFFRFSLNKTNKLMNHLNRNSYSVYIIHVAVMGFFALGMLNLEAPAYAKFGILTILTFSFSNLLVYAYDQLFEHRPYLKIAGLAVLFTALFAIINFGNKAQPTMSETSTPAPELGLHEAIIQGDMESVNLHIKAGSNLDKKEASGGSSPLITAATFGKDQIAKVLIEAGADVNFKNNEGSTPLHTAAFFCRTEIVEVLLENGADKSLKNNVGSTALESVLAPFEAVKGYYDYFGEALGPLGLKLDYEHLKTARPVIAEMLK